MARISKDPEVRRKEIVEAAMQLFREKGFAQTAVSDIVRKVGVAQGTFYYYFKSKEEIVFAIIQLSVSAQAEKIESIADNNRMTARDKLTKVLGEEIYSPSQYKMYLDFLHQENNALHHQKLIVAKIHAFAPMIAQILQQGTEEGQFQVEDPLEAAEFILTGMLFLFDQGIFQWTDSELRSKAKAVEKMIAKLLGVQLKLTKEP